MAKLKTLLTFMLAGAFLGLAGASWLGPKWLEWDNTTRLASTQTVCNLPEIIRDVTAQLLQMQLIGTLVGAGVALVVGFLFLRARAKREGKEAPPTAPGGPQPQPAP
jgi:hypothetical protein